MLYIYIYYCTRSCYKSWIAALGEFMKTNDDGSKPNELNSFGRIMGMDIIVWGNHYTQFIVDYNNNL